MRRAGVVLISVLATAACGSGGDTATGTFTVDFPSTEAAIAVVKGTPGVQVFAYSTTVLGSGSGAAANSCEMLVEQSRINTLMGATAVATSALLSPCDLMSGKGSLAIAYGSYAFLAVAQSSPGTDLLVGCAEQTISSSNTVVVIPMTIASSTNAIPPTTCTSLSQACPGGGSC